MFRRLLFILYYFISWVLFFELARVFFILYETQSSFTPTRLLLLSMWHGLKMDMSMAAYITAPVCLFVLLSIYVGFFRRKLIYLLYTGVILFLQLMITVADAEVYRAWGQKLDATPLNYITHPDEAKASIGHLPIFWIVVGLVVVFVVLFYFFRKLIKGNIDKLTWFTLRPVQVVVVLVFSALLIIPMRGGLQLSPLNHSAVFFSNDQFANNAAINASWNFLRSISKSEELTNPYEKYRIHTIREDRLLERPIPYVESPTYILDSSKNNPNIILILWESFTDKALHLKIDGKPIAPFFEKLRTEGIYFKNCYSSGDRTNKGLSAVISGYPALPKSSIINYPAKLPGLDGLGKILSKRGYDNWFYYGGEPEFANMKGYILDQQFRHLISKDDFPKKDQNSKWGAHDHVVMERILSDSRQYKQPFFTTFLTLTSHEPFETPVPTVFEGGSFSTRLMNTIHYTDSTLYEMINKMKNEGWWQNTIVVIVADHGHYEPATGDRIDDYRIPMLWLGGALNRRGITIEKTVNQLDIAASLLTQLKIPHDLGFSRDVFDANRPGFAYFTYNDGIGVITDSAKLIYDHTGQRVVYEKGSVEPYHIGTAKSLLYEIYQDFLSR